MSQPKASHRWVAVAIAAGLLSLAGARSWAVTIIKDPYLQQVTQTSIVVMWETDTATTGTVEYGPTAAYGWSATDASTATIHEVEITGLTPDSLYHYRAISGDATSSDSTFRTAPPPGVPFRFVAYGDTRTQISEHQQVINRIIASAPRLVLHTGDIVEDGRDYWRWEAEFFDPAASLMSNTPMALALGNHENNSHWYYDFFSNPTDSGTEAWYKFRYGDARFICVDTCQTYTTGSAQHNWLQSTLAQATDAIWTFVYFHHPPYTSGGHTGNTTVQTHLVPLFEQYDVDIVFNGHCHNYERSLKDGVYYIVTGGGGAPLAPVDQYDNPYRLYAERVYHHCVIDIDAGTLTCRGVRASNGSEFDQFTITKLITATSPTLSPGWHLISLPYEPQDPDPEVVFAGIPIDHALFRYATDTKSYVTYTTGDPGGTFGPADAHLGYWLHLTEPTVISYDAIRRDTPQYIDLPWAGWTLVGHPRDTVTAFDAMRIRNETTGSTYTLVVARAVDWISLPLYTYDPAVGGYLSVSSEPWRHASEFQPWSGYWIATNRDDLAMVVPAP